MPTKKDKGESVRIILKKSLIGSKKDQIATAEALGLKKTGASVTQPKNPQTMGKINKLSHLLEVQEV